MHATRSDQDFYLSACVDDAANDTTKWFERDLDDFLKEIHREPEENEKDEEDYENDGFPFYF